MTQLVFTGTISEPDIEDWGTAMITQLLTGDDDRPGMFLRLHSFDDRVALDGVSFDVEGTVAVHHHVEENGVMIGVDADKVTANGSVVFVVLTVGNGNPGWWHGWFSGVR